MISVMKCRSYIKKFLYEANFGCNVSAVVVSSDQQPGIPIMKINNGIALKFSLSLLILLFSNLNILYSQSTYKQLHIGDTVPDVAFNNVRNYTGVKKRLSDFNGKYIILDIWDKTCASCIKAMPKMQQLQKQFKDDLQIILLTKSSSDALSLLFKNSPILKNVALPMVLGDTILTRHIFPYRYLPLHIWLDKDRRVLAITEGSNADTENITKMIRGVPLNFTVREDILDDKEYNDICDENESLLFVNKSKYLSNLCYLRCKSDNNNIDTLTSLLLRRINGAQNSRIVILKDKTGFETGIRYINFFLHSLYRIAFNYYGDTRNKTLGKLLVEPGVNLPSEPKYQSEYLLWYDRMRFCYETTMREYTSQKGTEQLRKDLERFFGVTGTIEERLVNCLILFRTSKVDLLQYAKDREPSYFDPTGKFFKNTGLKGKFIFSNLPFNDFVAKMIIVHKYQDDPVILNETGFQNEKINMTLNVSNLRDILSLNSELKIYGLGIKEEQRYVKVLVLKNIKN